MYDSQSFPFLKCLLTSQMPSAALPFLLKILSCLICMVSHSLVFSNWLLSVQLSMSLCSLLFLQIGSWMQRLGQADVFCLARFLVVLYSFIRGSECLVVVCVCVCDISSHCCLMARFVNSVAFVKWWHFNSFFFF